MAFVWYELMTTDRAAAQAFYGAVCGWTFGGDGDYAEVIAEGGRRIGGILTRPPEAASMPPMWLGYIGVAELEPAIARLTEAGGRLHKGPVDMAGVGRWAVVADPQGAVFYLFEPARADDAADASAAVGWHELYATDADAALGFYHAQFGWEADETLDMGDHGKYRMFRAAGGSRAIGGIMRLPAPECPPMWNYYFLVPSVAAAADRIPAAGGAIRLAPMQVPGGSWVLQGVDPQGAAFALNSLSE